MANLVRRESREAQRSGGGGGGGGEYRWDPFRMMDALLRMDPFRSDWTGLTATSDFLPRFDVKESKDAFAIKADLPGVKESDLEVSLNGSQLTISGKREEERRDEGEQFYALERSSGSFARSFMLPESVDAEHVSAELKEGVLDVRIPKRPEAQPKKIAIGKAAASGDGQQQREDTQPQKTEKPAQKMPEAKS